MIIILVSLFIAIILIVAFVIVMNALRSPVSRNKDLEFSTDKNNSLEFIKWRVRELRRDSQLKNTKNIRLVK